jgi:16S rRNA (cytosine1402-N4)-methyltransferase
MSHIPVLAEEVIKFLNPKSNENFIDCTLGDGGHSALILKATSPNGKVLGFDLDSEAIEVASENLKEFKDRLLAVNESYAKLREVIVREKFGPVHGVLADFGFSSPQLEERNRGLSFLRDEPLDMRYNAGADLTAAEIVNTWPKDDLVKILREYGEERMADRIGSAIFKARREKRIISTLQLVGVVKAAVPKGYEHGRINPATRTFQALRIAVNDELGSIAKLMPQALDAIEAGGRLVFISFHSLEDRLVKNFFKENKDKLTILTPKPITASEEEAKSNPRARSAKLRAAVKR